jgi:hypothetical protein
MNPAITAALIAAAHQEEAEKLVLGRLRNARATGQSSAIPLGLDGDKRKLLDEALGNGTVKKTSDGRFYLDERAVADRKEGQGFLALVIILVCLSVVASAVALIAVFGD